jgi:predicted O-linked N-acetylglucosamine transferase (SPINDLY family)
LNQALELDGRFFEARINKTAVLFESGDYEEALTIAETLVEDEPHSAEAQLNLGNVLVHSGKTKLGVQKFMKALELKPGYAEAHFNLASLLGSKADLANTIEYLERRLKEFGDSVQTMGLLANAHHAAGNVAKAEDFSDRILAKQPDNLGALISRGACYSVSGDVASALLMYQRVMELDPTQWAIGSNIGFEYNNVAGVDRQTIFDFHLDWARKIEAPFLDKPRIFNRDRDPARKLRIGYVSGDFVRHPVGFLLRDILHHHDAANFSVHCFSMAVRPEDVLPELRKAADSWEDIFLLSDEDVVTLVEETNIDILFDLSGHTAFHRLAAFARRMAPVQVEWIGYFHSTGMSSIDYFVTDPNTSPAGTGQLFSETPVYLPHTRFCYGPPAYAPDPAPQPMIKNGHITFGSFNRLAKITDVVVRAWCEILQAVPGSRLLVKAGALSDELVRQRLLARFKIQNIDETRVELREGSGHTEMLAEYGDIDIALDTFPFNGGMTTLEALWMGVPVVTIAGNTVVSRQTVSALANIGLDEELAYVDQYAYVQGAIALANNPPRLQELREELRPRMRNSPLRDSEKFTKDLEMLLRRMWVAWCNGTKLDDETML